jgi:hypothetical protein
MHLDLRYPIGLLLTTYGTILALQGAIFRTTVLGLNVNLYWGAVMIACGAALLWLARRHRGKSAGPGVPAGTERPTRSSAGTP